MGNTNSSGSVFDSFFEPEPSNPPILANPIFATKPREESECLSSFTMPQDRREGGDQQESFDKLKTFLLSSATLTETEIGESDVTPLSDPEILAFLSENVDGIDM